MKYVVSGAFRDTGRHTVRTIDAPNQNAAMQIALDQGMTVESAAEYVPPPAAPAPQRVQVVAGVWTIALGVVVGNLVIVGGVLVLAFLLGFFDALARSLAGH